MNTLFFKYAIEIERTRSITKAAENLYMAQSNLSKAIKEVEDTLDFSIFERSSKGVIPTRKGVEFLAYARKILDQLDHIRRLADTENTDQQNFSISIPRSTYIAEGFARFVNELDMDKAMSINVQETNSVQTIRNIVDGQFRLGIIRFQTMFENYFLDYLAKNELDHKVFWEFEYLALMSRYHPLVQAEEVLHQELCQYVEIIHGDSKVPYVKDHLESNSIAKDIPQKKRVYLYDRYNQFNLLNTLQTAYMWVSPIPQKYLELHNLVQRKCAFSDNKTKDVIVYPKEYVFSEFDKMFLNKLCEARNEVSFQAYQ